VIKTFGVYVLVALAALAVYLTGVTHLAYFGILAGWALGVFLTWNKVEVFQVIRWIALIGLVILAVEFNFLVILPIMGKVLWATMVTYAGTFFIRTR